MGAQTLMDAQSLEGVSCPCWSPVPEFFCSSMEEGYGLQIMRATTWAY